MAVTFVAAGAFAGNATVPTQAITAPACAAGDILIATLVNKSATVNVISPPDATWTQITQGVTDCATAADDHEYAVFWKRATGSGGSFTFTKATDDNVLFGGVIAAWRGAEAQGSPLDAAAVVVRNQTATNSQARFDSFDPKNTNAHVIFITVYGNDLTTFAAAMDVDTNPDCTTRFDEESSIGTDVTIACQSGDSTDGGATGFRNWVSNASANAGSTGIVFALTPDSGAPYWVSTGSPSSGNGDVTPAWPSHQADDIGLLFVESSNQSASAPAGWAEVADSPQGTGTAGAAGSARLQVFWKRAASGAESSPTVVDTGNQTFAFIMVIRGCPTSGDPWDVTAGDVLATTGTAVTIPGDTTTGPGRLIVAAVAHAIDLAGAHVSGWANADLADLTERFDNAHATNNGGGVAVATGRLSQAGVYAATTATLDTTSLQARLSIALKPNIPGVTVTPGSLIASAAAVFTPTLRPAIRVVASSRIASSSAVHGPTVRAAVRVIASFIASGTVVHAPTVKLAVIVRPPLIVSTVVYAPTVHPAVILASSFIISGTQVYDPIVRPAVIAAPGFIAAAAQLFPPVVHEGRRIRAFKIGRRAIASMPEV